MDLTVEQKLQLLEKILSMTYASVEKYKGGRGSLTLDGYCMLDEHETQWLHNSPGPGYHVFHE